jgi:serine/threonine protein kinase/HD-like signal output (HDOD) protein
MVTISTHGTEYLASDGVPSMPRETAALLGQTLGPFRILGLLGQGAMGQVYKAEHQVIGRKAAIKVLAPKVAENPDIVARFFDEARAVNDIRHPNIVEVTDLGYVGHQPYLVMEMLDGETLEDRLQRTAMLSPVEAVRIAAQVASAVGAAHDHGIVHRDLKPANLFICRHPDYPDYVKVLDFGVAKLSDERNPHNHQRTTWGAVIGTPAYMSPEQCLGEATLDHRSDIYSLGIVLYQMVTGRCPFEGDTLGRMTLCHVQIQPRPPRELRPELPPELNRIILRALEKERDHRFPSMRDLRAALVASVTGAMPQDQVLTPGPVPAAVVEDAATSATMMALGPVTQPPHIPTPAPVVITRTPATPTPQPNQNGEQAVIARLTEILRARIETGSIALPPLRPRVVRCLELVNSSDVSFAALAAILNEEPPLASRVIQLANATGALRMPAHNAEQAVRRLGAQGLHTVLLEISARAALEPNHHRLEALFKQPWPHALATACIADRLARATGHDEREATAAYRDGLIHDIGKPIIGGLLLEIERQMASTHGRRLVSDVVLLTCIELTHAAAGAQLARAWNLPEWSAEAIHMAGQSAESGWTLGNVLRLADALASLNGFHLNRADLSRALDVREKTRLAMSLDESVLPSCTAGVREAVARKAA